MNDSITLYNKNNTIVFPGISVIDSNLEIVETGIGIKKAGTATGYNDLIIRMSAVDCGFKVIGVVYDAKCEGGYPNNSYVNFAGTVTYFPYATGSITNKTVTMNPVKDYLAVQLRVYRVGSDKNPIYGTVNLKSLTTDVPVDYAYNPNPDIQNVEYVAKTNTRIAKITLLGFDGDKTVYYTNPTLTVDGKQVTLPYELPKGKTINIKNEAVSQGLSAFIAYEPYEAKEINIDMNLDTSRLTSGGYNFKLDAKRPIAINQSFSIDTHREVVKSATNLSDTEREVYATKFWVDRTNRTFADGSKKALIYGDTNIIPLLIPAEEIYKEGYVLTGIRFEGTIISFNDVYKVKVNNGSWVYAKYVKSFPMLDGTTSIAQYEFTCEQPIEELNIKAVNYIGENINKEYIFSTASDDTSYRFQYQYTASKSIPVSKNINIDTSRQVIADTINNTDTKRSTTKDATSSNDTKRIATNNALSINDTAREAVKSLVNRAETKRELIKDAINNYESIRKVVNSSEEVFDLRRIVNKSKLITSDSIRYIKKLYDSVFDTKRSTSKNYSTESDTTRKAEVSAKVVNPTIRTIEKSIVVNNDSSRRLIKDHDLNVDTNRIATYIYGNINLKLDTARQVKHTTPTILSLTASSQYATSKTFTIDFTKMKFKIKKFRFSLDVTVNKTAYVTINGTRYTNLQAVALKYADNGIDTLVSTEAMEYIVPDDATKLTITIELMTSSTYSCLYMQNIETDRPVLSGAARNDNMLISATSRMFIDGGLILSDGDVSTVNYISNVYTGADYSTLSTLPREFAAKEKFKVAKKGVVYDKCLLPYRAIRDVNKNIDTERVIKDDYYVFDKDINIDTTRQVIKSSVSKSDTKRTSFKNAAKLNDLMRKTSNNATSKADTRRNAVKSNKLIADTYREAICNINKAYDSKRKVVKDAIFRSDTKRIAGLISIVSNYTERIVDKSINKSNDLKREVIKDYVLLNDTNRILGEKYDANINLDTIRQVKHMCESSMQLKVSSQYSTSRTYTLDFEKMKFRIKKFMFNFNITDGKSMYATINGTRYNSYDYESVSVLSENGVDTLSVTSKIEYIVPDNINKLTIEVGLIMSNSIGYFAMDSIEVDRPTIWGYGRNANIIMTSPVRAFIDGGLQFAEDDYTVLSYITTVSTGTDYSTSSSLPREFAAKEKFRISKRSSYYDKCIVPYRPIKDYETNIDTNRLVRDKYYIFDVDMNIDTNRQVVNNDMFIADTYREAVKSKSLIADTRRTSYKKVANVFDSMRKATRNALNKADTTRLAVKSAKASQDTHRIAIYKAKNQYDLMRKVNIDAINKSDLKRIVDNHKIVTNYTIRTIEHHVDNLYDTKRTSTKDCISYGDTRRLVSNIYSSNVILDTKRTVIKSDISYGETLRRLIVSKEINADTDREVLKRYISIVDTNRIITKGYPVDLRLDSIRQVSKSNVLDLDTTRKTINDYSNVFDSMRKAVNDNNIALDTSRLIFSATVFLNDLERYVVKSIDVNKDTSRITANNLTKDIDALRKAVNFGDLGLDTRRTVLRIPVNMDKSLKLDTIRQVRGDVEYNLLLDTNRRVYKEDATSEYEITLEFINRSLFIRSQKL